MNPARLRFAPTWLALLLVASARADDPWHLSGWKARAVVEIAQPSTEPNADTAAVKVLCQGRAKPDGSDYRVVDVEGKPVPFQVTFHDADRYSLISFRAANPKQRFFVYFGNVQAARAPEEIITPAGLGAGPPKAAWIPKQGLVLATIQRPEGDNPKTVKEMAKLIAGSPRKHGARYQRRISDGYNLFGSSDYYISIYRGWIRIPKAGVYRFCTASNEASFSFLDGKELIHWPGRHTAERGSRGEVNAAVELTAGLHYVEYYHEEVTLEQMAFLGWRTSGDEGQFSPIPESAYPAPHEAAVVAYQQPAGAPVLHFEPVITDSVWPATRTEGQYTRVKFAVGRTLPPTASTTLEWNFGDGQTATGPETEHVYLALGIYPVTLTARKETGSATATATWKLEVYEIENVTDQFKEGRPDDYAKLAAKYDRAKLDANALKELAFLFAEAEQPADAIAVGKEWVTRFAASKPEMAPKVRRLLADCALQLGQGATDEAIANYEASLAKDTLPLERFTVLARLIRLLGVERKLPDKADAVLARVEETAKGLRMDEDTRTAYRKALIAAGDAKLWQDKPNAARELYRKAESNGPFIPPQVKAARIGAFPDSLREYIATGNHGAALDLVDRWENTFPSEKLLGQTAYWRGKLTHLRGQYKEAARLLERAIKASSGAVYESEARWLLAVSLEQAGRADDAKRELAKLIALGGRDEFSLKARERLSKEVKPK